nr:M14 family zinc carboxypeptidase [Micromonospora chokoriensis]
MDSPAIVWVTANVHGGVKSGTDAALKTLYELAAGLSCEVARRNDNLVTIIVPTQNPDGRDATRRQNDFGFDLNGTGAPAPSRRPTASSNCCAATRRRCSSTRTRWAAGSTSSHRTPTRSTTRSPARQWTGSAGSARPTRQASASTAPATTPSPPSTRMVPPASRPCVRTGRRS